VSCLGAFVGVNIKRRVATMGAKNVVGGERPPSRPAGVAGALAAQAFGVATRTCMVQPGTIPTAMGDPAVVFTPPPWSPLGSGARACWSRGRPRRSRAQLDFNRGLRTIGYPSRGTLRCDVPDPYRLEPPASEDKATATATATVRQALSDTLRWCSGQAHTHGAGGAPPRTSRRRRRRRFVFGWPGGSSLYGSGTSAP